MLAGAVSVKGRSDGTVHIYQLLQGWEDGKISQVDIVYDTLHSLGKISVSSYVFICLK